MNYLFLSTILFLFLNCAINQKSEITHPTKENFSTSDNQIKITDLINDFENQLSQSFDSLTLKLEIGELYGDPILTFGFIKDIEID